MMGDDAGDPPMEDDFIGAMLDGNRLRQVRHVPTPTRPPLPPLDTDLVEVAYGYHANGYAGGGYAYRTGGLRVRVGSFVVVPATSLSPREQVATVVRVGSDYRGPTARLLRIQRHKHSWQRVCAGCGKKEAE